tara:strand:+ start:7138 stop:7965 length:828 start_codon:yes stop_codon:yes gene_type:complete
MATLTWIGADGNWNTAASWSTGALPTNGDDVYFVSGSNDVTTGPTSAVNLNSINFGTKWSGSAVKITTNATTIDYANKSGTVILEGTYTTINVQATSGDNPALTLDDSTITTMRITGGSGTVLIQSNTSVSGAIDMIGCKSARLEIEAGSNVSAADITIDAGRVVSYEELDSITQYGGVVTMANAGGTTNTVNLYKGILKYQPTSTATLTTLTVYGGYFDLRGCNTPTHTITNTSIYSGGMIDERNGLSNTTWTNPINSFQGVFVPDNSRSITVT